MKKFFRFTLSIRAKFILYLLALHCVFAAVVTNFLWSDRIWLIAVELLFLISYLIALHLFRVLFRPLELLASAAEIMKEKDFTTRFLEVGQPEMDSMIEVYNRMIERLEIERVRQQEQHFFLDKVLSVSPSGIITFDFDGRIDMINPSAEKALGMSRESLAKKRLEDVHTPFSDALAEMAIGESQVIVLHGMRRLKCHRSHFIDRGFRREFILMEELTEELRQSEKAAYEKLIRMMSHEVNNSLGAANSLLYSVLNYKGQLKDEDRTDFENAIAVVISRTEHLNAFMKSFADIVRLPVPRKSPADPLELLRGVEVLMSAECHRRNILWKWNVSTSDPIGLDRTQMEQAFVNIVKNAMEAIGDNGTIGIRTGVEDGKQFLRIEDSGSGIAPEVREHLFTPFYTTKENGQGIGLTTIREILTRHDFEFALESENGTTRFTIWF